ncbi:hypothetical protein M404DRAFT_996898, partial [Pisolithus tinctorius Marx 270]
MMQQKKCGRGCCALPVLCGRGNQEAADRGTPFRSRRDEEYARGYGCDRRGFLV